MSLSSKSHRKIAYYASYILIHADNLRIPAYFKASEILQNTHAWKMLLACALNSSGLEMIGEKEESDTQGKEKSNFLEPEDSGTLNSQIYILLRAI